MGEVGQGFGLGLELGLELERERGWCSDLGRDWNGS